jgi:S-adenosylmethionine decarboxylase
LFVYPLKLVIKTCGTTTLLAALPRLLDLTLKLAMRVEWVAYTRKDFKFPQAQKFPHRGPKEEIGYLKELFPEGSAFLMGPVTGDHWLVFVADYVDRETTDCVDRTLDIMMFDLDPEVRARVFYLTEA